MARTQTVDLRFPVAGLDRRYGFQDQGPYTTPDAQNVRPDGTLKGRERGGSRPGLEKAYNQKLGGGTKIQFIKKLYVPETTGYHYFQDTFPMETLRDHWTAASWIGVAPSITDDCTTVEIYDVEAGAVLEEIPGIDITQPYSVAIRIEPCQKKWAGHYRIYARMNPGDPDVTEDGIWLDLEMSGYTNAYTVRLIEYTSSTGKTSTASGTLSGAVEGGWLKLVFNTSTLATVYWRETEVLQKTVGDSIYTVCGFGGKATMTGGVCLFDTFQVAYYQEATEEKEIVITAADGNVYHDNGTTTMSLMAADCISDDKLLQAAPRYGKLYIADYDEPVIEGVDGAFADTEFRLLTSVSVDDWTALGIDVDTMVCEIFDAQGAVTEGTYGIESVSAGGVTLEDSVGGTGTCSFRIGIAPRIADPSDDTVVTWLADTGKGAVPTGCPLICSWRDRMVLAGPSHVVYLSRAGDPHDWDYAADVDDGGRAVAFTLDDGSHMLPDKITALIPWTDDYLVLAGLDSLWIMRGDPALGGQLDNLDRAIGILGPNAWCLAPGGVIYFLSADGLYYLSPGGKPESVSREKMPRELLGIDTAEHWVSLEMDTYARGIHISTTPLVGGIGTGSGSPPPTGTGTGSPPPSGSGTPPPTGTPTGSGSGSGWGSGPPSGSGYGAATDYWDYFFDPSADGTINPDGWTPTPKGPYYETIVCAEAGSRTGIITDWGGWTYNPMATKGAASYLTYVGPTFGPSSGASIVFTPTSIPSNVLVDKLGLYVYGYAIGASDLIAYTTVLYDYNNWGTYSLLGTVQSHIIPAGSGPGWYAANLRTLVPGGVYPRGKYAARFKFTVNFFPQYGTSHVRIYESCVALNGVGI